MVKVCLQPRQLAAQLGGFQPQREFGDFDAFGIDVNAKQVAVQNLVADVNNQQLTGCQLAQLEVELGVGFFEHIKRGDQKRTRAASWVTHTNAAQLGLPGQPKGVFSDVGRGH